MARKISQPAKGSSTAHGGIAVKSDAAIRFFIAGV